MSYGKLVVKLEVLDPSLIGDEDDVFTKRMRQVTMFTQHSVTYSQAHKLVMAFVESNVPERQRSDLEVFWYPEPVRIGTWHN